jgi:hypothetical protein
VTCKLDNVLQPMRELVLEFENNEALHEQIEKVEQDQSLLERISRSRPYRPH